MLPTRCLVWKTVIHGKDNRWLSSVITDVVARNDVLLLVVWLFSELQFLVYCVRYLVWEH